MEIAYGILWGGLVTFVVVCYRPPDPPCPKISWKCWVAMVIGFIGAATYFAFQGFRIPITATDFIAGIFAAVGLGGFGHRLLCPLK